MTAKKSTAKKSVKTAKVIPTIPKPETHREGKLIFEKMGLVLRDIIIVGKEMPKKKQDGATFKTQPVGKIISSVHNAMAKHGVFMTKRLISSIGPEIVHFKKSDGTMYTQDWEFTFWAADGSSIKTQSIGIGVDNSDKGINKAMSYAFKYALIQTFLVPSNEADPDSIHKEITHEKPVVRELSNANKVNKWYWAIKNSFKGNEIDKGLIATYFIDSILKFDECLADWVKLNKTGDERLFQDYMQDLFI